jgi:hypothetical protein
VHALDDSATVTGSFSFTFFINNIIFVGREVCTCSRGPSSKWNSWFCIWAYDVGH